MTNLIFLRQRLKVVDTIKKTTNAMRLISMSLHSRLRHKKQYLEAYKKELFQLVPLFTTTPITQDQTKDLVIIIGSQKGLCGTFNTALFTFFKSHAAAPCDVIIVGKQMANLCILYGVAPKTVYPELNASNFITLATQLSSIILSDNYRLITVFSNQPKTFFIQQQVATVVWPLALPDTAETTQEYLYEQSPQELSAYLCTLLVKVHMQELLFSSLLAEQSARFISMDNSTRNAENLLQSMKLQYNKRRQADITRELSDLTGSFDSQS